ncbi:3-deoxy-D-manno-octulosonic acid transferase [Halocynthiibacter namhaensis]|uniref:3-deoxy-D-manno-octulosonic acid transferase n=1 Tax=Halocynthiibacter namhaensis TaxID=1290553 RepID=UPI0005794917|nr:glycosyltransferase N-terminal domain-containing protein [Halocynthiibacter namhaensis]
MKKYPKSIIDRAFLVIWSLLYHAILPLGILYFKRRGRKEPVYAQNLSERFGVGRQFEQGAIWIHAASLGELRAAKPLLDAFLARGERIILTTMSAAGNHEAHSAYAQAMTDDQLIKVWCPLDLGWAFSRFFTHYRPKLGIVLETELWPQMIAQSNHHSVPLVMLQAQYPDVAYARDKKWLRMRGRLATGFNLILAKSERHKARFETFGANVVQVMGEMRFEQPVPDHHVEQGLVAKNKIAGKRRVICLASTALDEDETLIPVVAKLLGGPNPPLVVYVPRHPKDFDASYQSLNQAGLKVSRRSDVLDHDLNWVGPTECDFLFGDSLGEIYFYFAMCDFAFIGDTFNNEGSHNVIEPMCLHKPVVIGPSMWGIEYPGIEAIEAGVLTKVETGAELLAHWQKHLAAPPSDPRISEFCKNHGGATRRALELLSKSGYIGP